MSKIIKLSKLSQGPSNLFKNSKTKWYFDWILEACFLYTKRLLCIPPLALIISYELRAVSWIESLSIIVLSITDDRTSLKKLLWSLSPVMLMLFPKPSTNFWAIFWPDFLADCYNQFKGNFDKNKAFLGNFLADIIFWAIFGPIFKTNLRANFGTY